LTVAGVLALVASSFYLHRLTHDLSMTVESLRLAEQLQAELLAHHHAAVLGSISGSVEHARMVDAAGVKLLRTLSWAHGHASVEREHEILRPLEDGVRAYLDEVASLDAASTTTVEERARALARSFDKAFDRSEELVEYHLERARTARRHANVEAGVAVAGLVLALALVGALALLARTLRKEVFVPLMSVDAAMRAYLHERSSRAPEIGTTEVRGIAQAFNTVAAELQAQRENQTRFLAGVAHDLRSPLGAWKMACDALDADRPLPSAAHVRRFIAMSSRSIARLNTMVDDLLDITRVELGQLRFHPKPCDVRELARDTAALFESASPSHRVDLDLPDAPLTATCDAARIAQVLNNLVSNAIKYSPDGGVVRIAARGQGTTAVLEVEDPGIGIPEAELATIFQPFRRSSFAKENIPGVGLGLFTSRQILEAHGGELTVESTPGRGSSFRLVLPSGSGQYASDVAPQVETPRGPAVSP
jgi:signal transduction histidine kinase